MTDFFPVLLRFWEGDEEFPPKLQLMWDRNTGGICVRGRIGCPSGRRGHDRRKYSLRFGRKKRRRDKR
ncbi:MAG: DUF3786 domain-containing protein [Oscillospiraceae bacterium]|nr:DUF3786 domain-containing protein [Oscillospiraceae bacterium]